MMNNLIESFVNVIQGIITVLNRQQKMIDSLMNIKPIENIEYDEWITAIYNVTTTTATTQLLGTLNNIGTMLIDEKEITPTQYFKFDNVGTHTVRILLNKVGVLPDLLFSPCNNLRVVYLPKSTKSLGAVFYNNKGIEKIYCFAEKEPSLVIGNINGTCRSTFQEINTNGTFHYPIGSDYSYWLSTGIATSCYTDKSGFNLGKYGWKCIDDLGENEPITKQIIGYWEGKFGVYEILGSSYYLASQRYNKGYRPNNTIITFNEDNSGEIVDQYTMPYNHSKRFLINWLIEDNVVIITFDDSSLNDITFKITDINKGVFSYSMSDDKAIMTMAKIDVNIID